MWSGSIRTGTHQVRVREHQSTPPSPDVTGGAVPSHRSNAKSSVSKGMIIAPAHHQPIGGVFAEVRKAPVRMTGSGLRAHGELERNIQVNVNPELSRTLGTDSVHLHSEVK